MAHGYMRRFNTKAHDAFARHRDVAVLMLYVRVTSSVTLVLVCCRQFRGAAVVEMECNIKACRVLASQKVGVYHVTSSLRRAA